MPALSDHQSSTTTKILLIGNSGSGKTGALASLAAAGYNLRIMDLDNGVDILANLLRDKTKYPPEALGRVAYETITDPMRNMGGKLVPKSATVWQRASKLLDNWKTETENFGPVQTWTPQEVLVIDSLTFISAAALNLILALNGRLGQRPHQSDWMDGQTLVEGLLAYLYDDSVNCNVIVNSHITFIGDEGNMIGYPSTLGKSLPPKVGRYFNNTLIVKSQGQGQMTKRKILTNPSGVIEAKNSNPSKVKAEYDLATGLADYFKDVRS